MMQSPRMSVGVLTALILLAGCAGTGKAVAPPEDLLPDVGGPAAAAPAIGATRVGSVEFRRYDGPRAGDSRLAALRARMERTVVPTMELAEDRAGVTFLPGRDAAVVLVDGDAASGRHPTGGVTVRVLDGVRRPVIRVPVDRLLAGTFLPEVHFPPLVVEAAVVASAGERAAPAWLRAGLGVELTGAFERILHERALGGAAVRTSASALLPPTPAGDDPLRAAARVRALDRIARGDRALARYVVARLEGMSETDALALVGVQDAVFLDAAAETERDVALEGLLSPGLDTLALARDALSAGEPARAVAPASALEAGVREGRLSPWVEADARVTLAEFLHERGDAAGAREQAQAALVDTAHLVRVREARLAQARSAGAAGDRREASALFRSYVADFPGAPGSDEALESLGVPPALAAAVPGIATEISSEDPKLRQRAAVRLGETGDPLAVDPLRDLVQDTDADVRRLALAALAMALGDEAVPELKLGTRDPTPSVRGAALSLLAFADPAQGEKRAWELEDDAAPEVRTVVDRVLAPARSAAAERLAEEAAAAATVRAAAAKVEGERLARVAEEARRKAAAAAAAQPKPAPIVQPVTPPVRPVRPVVPPPPPDRTRRTPPPGPERPAPPKPPVRVHDPKPPVVTPPKPPLRDPPVPVVTPPKPPHPLPPPKKEDPVPDGTRRKPPPPKPPARTGEPDARDERSDRPPPPSRGSDDRS